MNAAKVLSKIRDALKADHVELDLLLPGSFIAGASVGNIVLNEKHGLKLPINDVDIFIEQSLQIEDSVSDLEDYIDPTSPDVSPKIQINGVERSGLLNYIFIDKTNFDSRAVAETILEGFDFNCVKVGILKRTDGTWDLVTSNDFDQCALDRQVRVTKVTYPFRTLVRLFKKRDELKGLYFADTDIRLCFNLVAHHPNLLIAPSTLEKHFKYVAKTLRGGFSFTEMKYKSGAIKYQVTANKNHLFYIRLNQKVRIATKGSIKLDRYLRLYLNSALPKRKRLESLSGFPGVLKSLLSKNEDVPVTMASIKELITASRMTLKYPNLLLKDELDINFGIKAISYVKQAVAKNLIIAKTADFQSGVWGYMDEVLEQVSSFERAQELIEKYTKEMHHLYEEVVSRLDLNLDGVTELVTKAQLSAEGSQMNHCVSGYSNRIKSGQSRIFAITSENGRSTLEVFVDQGLDKAYISQHRARFNKEPVRECSKIALEIIKGIRKLSEAKKEKIQLKVNEVALVLNEF